MANFADTKMFPKKDTNNPVLFLGMFLIALAMLIFYSAQLALLCGAIGLVFFGLYALTRQLLKSNTEITDSLNEEEIDISLLVAFIPFMVMPFFILIYYLFPGQ